LPGTPLEIGALVAVPLPELGYGAEALAVC